MTATKDPRSVPSSSEPSSEALGWQPYRYGEPPIVAETARGRSGRVAVVLGVLALLVSLASVISAMIWLSTGTALILAATAAVLGLSGVVSAVLALTWSRTGTATGGRLAVVGTSLSAAGFATALLWTVVLVLMSVATPLATAGWAPVVPVPASPTAPTAAPVAGAERQFRFEVTGTVPAAAISYQFAGTSGGDTVPAPVPWSKDVKGGTGDESFSINAVSTTGQQGSVTCTISDAVSGTVLDTKTVETDGSPQSSAYVNCHFYG